MIPDSTPDLIVLLRRRAATSTTALRVLLLAAADRLEQQEYMIESPCVKMDQPWDRLTVPEWTDPDHDD